MEGDLTLGGEHTTQYTDDVLQNCIPETCINLLTNVTQVKFFKKTQANVSENKGIKEFQKRKNFKKERTANAEH